jgi:hypothetical protein
MKTNLLPTLLKFLAVTLPLTWWWMNGGQQQYWTYVYKPFAFPVLGWLGVTTFPPSVVRERLMNFLPFLALMISTPGMRPTVRAKRSALGFGLIFLGQIGLAWWASVVYQGRTGPQSEAAAAFFPAVVASDALPFVLWALMAREFVTALLASVMPPAPAKKSAPVGEASKAAAQPAPASSADEDEAARTDEVG